MLPAAGEFVLIVNIVHTCNIFLIHSFNTAHMKRNIYDDVTDYLFLMMKFLGN